VRRSGLKEKVNRRTDGRTDEQISMAIAVYLSKPLTRQNNIIIKKKKKNLLSGAH